MLLPEVIDRTAAGIAVAHLNPESNRAIDRSVYAPLAVLAIRNTDGKIALQNSRPRRGLTLPISHAELPPIDSLDPDLAAETTAEFISEITDSLRVSKYVQSVSGLWRPDGSGTFVSSDKDRLQDGRRIVVIPFMAMVSSDCRPRDLPWHSPTAASQHLIGKHPGLSSTVKHAILNLSERRLESERRLPYLQNAQKQA